MKQVLLLGLLVVIMGPVGAALLLAACYRQEGKLQSKDRLMESLE